MRELFGGFLVLDAMIWAVVQLLLTAMWMTDSGVPSKENSRLYLKWLFLGWSWPFVLVLFYPVKIARSFKSLVKAAELEEYVSALHPLSSELQSLPSSSSSQPHTLSLVNDSHGALSKVEE